MYEFNFFPHDWNENDIGFPGVIISSKINEHKQDHDTLERVLVCQPASTWILWVECKNWREAALVADGNDIAHTCSFTLNQ